MSFYAIKQISIFSKFVLFSLLIAVSGAGMAQENSNEFSNTVSVEVEKININHADAITIARVLDGIGISKANAIVNFREEYGSFYEVEDLLLVKGVGEVTLRNNEGRFSFD